MLEAYMDAYLSAIGEDKGTPLFPRFQGADLEPRP
jgi:hypothetical protein